MAESTHGWQTVLPSAHNRVDRLDRAQLADYERQALELWAKIDGDWSGWYVQSSNPLMHPSAPLRQRTDTDI